MLSDESCIYLKEKLADFSQHTDRYFGNARTIRNFLNIAISEQANRLLTENTTSKEDLVTLQPIDLATIFENKEENA